MGAALPSAATLAAFSLTAVLLVAVPGPNLVLICTRAAVHGFPSGLASALGVEAATLMHSSAAALGLASLVARAPGALSAVRVGGAVYLLYLAYRCWRGRRRTAGPPPSASGSFREGFMVNLLNPKVLLFFLAFLPQFVAATPGSAAARTQFLVLGFVFFVIALALDVGYAVISSRIPIRRWLGTSAAGAVVAGVYLVLGVLVMLPR